MCRLRIRCIFALCSIYVLDILHLSLLPPRSHPMTPTDPIQLADHEATELALENGIEELMAGAIDPEVGAMVLADLLAHELTAIHRLMMRLTGAAHGVLDWCVGEEAAGREAGGPAPDTGPADLAAGRLAGTAS